MRQKILLLFCFGMFLFASKSYAQEISVTGTVKNEKGGAIAAASVKIKGTTRGTMTNEDGHFKIKVNEGATIVVSAIGYVEEEKSASSVTDFVLKISDAAKAGEEVIVVGYGSGRKVSSVVGSVVNVSGKDLVNKPTANVFDALQGRVAGLSVLTSSGEPSATPSLSIHGIGSLGASSTPLYVMDGIPVNSGTVVSLNPNDIESVSVLKDASATSIYGSRAANGVVYITTKKGELNRPAQISLNGIYGVSQLANTDPFESFMNTAELTKFWLETGYHTQAEIDALLKKYPNDTRWYKEYYKKNTPSYQANLSISGGGGKTTYFVSGGYFKQEGIAYRSDYKRWSLRSNITSTVTNWMKFGINLFTSYDERQTNPYGSNSTNRGLAMLALPIYSPRDANGKPYPDIIPGWNRHNPKYLADKNPSIGNNLQFNPSGFVQINPLPNLTLKSQAGMDGYIYTSTAHRLPSYSGSLNNGSTSESYDRGIARTITNTIEYKFNVKSIHRFTLLAGQEYTDYDDRNFDASSTGQTDDRLILLQNGPDNKDGSSGRSQYAYNSYFGRLDYSLFNKYYFDASIRQDESSRFGADNRKATFWSVGGMWKAKQEDFLKNVKWLTDLTIRATTGTSGNSAIGNYQSLATVGTSQYDGETGWQISSPGNPKLSWEKQSQTNVGINANLFDRIRLDVQWYNRVTKNMLIDVPYPYTSGFSSVTSNVGAMKNSGIDFSLDFDVLKSKDAYITPFVTFNYNKEKVTSLFQGKKYWIIPNTGVAWIVGQPVMFYYPVFAQVNSQTGAPEWYLPGSDITKSQFDKSKVTSTFDENALNQNTGIKRHAPFNGGFGLNAGYKGIYLNVNFSFSEGKHLINNARYFYENPNVFAGYNQMNTVFDYWKKPGDIAKFPDYNNYQFTQFDSRLIEDASFLRLKALTLGYRIPNKLLSRTKVINGINVYFTGRNLLTFTKYSGEDPEVDSNLALGTYPNTKQYTFGLTLTF